MSDSSGGRSLVAGANALFRANESLRTPPRILSDPFAHLFAEHDPRVSAIRYGRFALPALRNMIDELQTVHCVRHASIDALVLKAIDEGYRQVVVVGAGYDMRAYRFTNRVQGVAWFEADHPATLARKERCLAGTNTTADVQRLGIDLEREGLGEKLAATPFDWAEPACFILEGLVHYLSLARLGELLRAIAFGAGSRRVILSYIRTDMYDSAPGLFIRLVKMVHEVPRLHFTPDGLAQVLSEHGLAQFQTWRLAGQIESFVPQAAGRRNGVSQDVVSVDRR